MSWREYLNLGTLFMGNKSVEAKTFDVVATIGAEAANVIDVAVQLNDTEGVALSEVGVVDFYLSSDALGEVPVAATTSLAAGAAGAVLEFIANTAGKLITDDVGLVNLAIGDVGVATYYLIIELPMGGKKIIGPITFA